MSDSDIKTILDDASNLSLNQIRRLLSKMTAPEIAHALESSPPKQRNLLFSLLKTEEEGDVLFELGEEIQQDLVSNISNEELIEAVKELELDEIVDILQNLPEERMNKILSNMSLVDRKRIEIGLTFPDNTAGGLLNTDVISVRPNNSINEVISYLRDQVDLPENTDKIFVVNNENEYLGELLISKIITSKPTMLVREIMETEFLPIDADLNDKEVATLFERNDLISSSVVDKDGKLIGRITIDDVVDVIREDADQNLLGMAGVAEDTFAPPGRAAKSRVFWLSMNLVTAFIAASTINLFQDVIDKIVYLAVLMPIVASMGGVAATQTLGIYIRAEAMRQLNRKNLRYLFRREFLVALANCIVFSVAIYLITSFWFNDYSLSIAISIAMIFNLLAAAIFGFVLPLSLRKFGYDPAIAGGVVITTVTDIIGFVSFLGIISFLVL
mgnify:CR=1 FL=1